MWKWTSILLLALLVPAVAPAQTWSGSPFQAEQRRRDEEDRRRWQNAAGHIARGAGHLHFKAPKTYTPSSGSSRSWGGALAAIGSGLAALFGAIFARRK